MRAHIVLPDDLVEEIDRIVGKRQRSAFIAEATRERLRREKRTRALQQGAGILKEEDYQHWATPEKVARWVRKVRRESERGRRIRGRLSA
jgi:predicted transcriptional regulator